MNPDDIIRKNRRTGLIILAIFAAMTALAFAAVPLYKRFCQVTGYGGTPAIGATAAPTKILKRVVTIKFNADTAPNMPWDFKPEKPEITVHLGQKGFIAFRARNLSGKTTAGTALYNVTPLKVGRYFHKIQCFCFDKQYLAPNQRADLPVVFYVDPAMNDNPNMEDVDNITLSYTFFPADSKQFDSALKKYYKAN